MLLEELKSNILLARDIRDGHIEDYNEHSGSTVVLSINIPGDDKYIAGVLELFDSGCSALKEALNVRRMKVINDHAGPFMICKCYETPETAKQVSVKIEETIPAGRLLDIDIYQHGKQLGRREFGLPPRECIVCGDPAVNCIRSKNHDVNTITNQVKRMLQRTHSI